MIDSDPIECYKCGYPHTRCTAHRRDGSPCGNMRMVGQTICRMHGGMAPRNRAAGLRRREMQIVEADAKAKLAHYAEEGLPVNPLEMLSRLTAEAIAMKDALARRVNALESVRFVDDKGGEQLRSEIALYERALDRSAKFVDLMARSGFEAARVKLEEQQGQLVAHVIRRILEQLELNEHQEILVAEVVPTELRKLGEG